MMQFESPFAHFIFLHWTFSMFAVMVYLITWSLTHWKVYVEGM